MRLADSMLLSLCLKPLTTPACLCCCNRMEAEQAMKNKSKQQSTGNSRAALLRLFLLWRPTDALCVRQAVRVAQESGKLDESRQSPTRSQAQAQEDSTHINNKYPHTHSFSHHSYNRTLYQTKPCSHCRRAAATAAAHIRSVFPCEATVTIDAHCLSLTVSVKRLAMRQAKDR